MAGVKTERVTAGHKAAPKRDKGYVAPAKVITIRLPKGMAPAIPTAPIPAKLPQTDAEKAAVIAYDAAVKAVAAGKPGDNSSEAKRSVAYQRLVQLGLRGQIRGRRR